MARKPKVHVANEKIRPERPTPASAEEPQMRPTRAVSTRDMIGSSRRAKRAGIAILLQGKKKVSEGPVPSFNRD